MRNSFLTITSLILLFQNAFGQNGSWVKKDKELIESVGSLNRENPIEVEAFFKKYKYGSEKVNTGFGWSMWNLEIPDGYIYITATFIYFNDSIISYEIKPELPLFIYGLLNSSDEKTSIKNQKKYLKIYKSWYSPYFICDSSEIKPYRYHFEQVNKPLAEFVGIFDLNNSPKNYLEFMSPYSNTLYSRYKREDFEKLKNNLTPNQIELLMYSLNPACRLTAIEYYFKNKNKFTDHEKIDAWAERVFNELPETETFLGCIVGIYNTRKLVKEIFGNEK